MSSIILSSVSIQRAGQIAGPSVFGGSLLARILVDYLPASTASWLAGGLTGSGQLSPATSLPSSRSSSSTLPLTPTTTTFSIHTLQDLLSGWLLAVPKHKTTHSRKGMRSANKGLKNKDNISLCPACSTPKLSHHLCPRCHSQISRRWKEEARAESGQLTGQGRAEGFA